MTILDTAGGRQIFFEALLAGMSSKECSEAVFNRLLRLVPAGRESLSRLRHCAQSVDEMTPPVPQTHYQQVIVTGLCVGVIGDTKLNS